MGDGYGNHSTQIIYGDSTLNITGLGSFEKSQQGNRGLPYAVVSIIGPQSSGKSTLVNHLFNTDFQVMDEKEGRLKTTHGLWMAKCADTVPCTIVMDIEGSDGQERGQVTTFEKQAAVFSFAVSDVILFNIWWKDIDREHGACIPLLRTVCQAMVKWKSSTRRRTLMFVVRDTTDTVSKEKLELRLRERMQEIMQSALDYQAYRGAALSEFLNVEVAALPNYEFKRDEFVKQVAQLRQQIVSCIVQGDLFCGQEGIDAASMFSVSVQEIWKQTKSNKDLDLPSQKIMTDIVRCGAIVNAIYSCFQENETWCQLKDAVESGDISGFSTTTKALLESSLSRYDRETVNFEEDYRAVERTKLKKSLLQLVEPVYATMLQHLGSQTLEEFKGAFNEALMEKNKSLYESAGLCAKRYLAKFQKECADVTVELEMSCDDPSKVRDTLKLLINANVAIKREEFMAEERIASIDKERAKLWTEKERAEHMREKERGEKERCAFMVEKDRWEKERNELRAKNEQIEEERNALMIEKEKLLEERRAREEKLSKLNESIGRKQKKPEAVTTALKVLKGISWMYRVATLDIGILVDVFELFLDDS